MREPKRRMSAPRDRPIALPDSTAKEGLVVLFLVYLALLSGRYDLGKLAPEIAGLDVRAVFAVAVTLCTFAWMGVRRAEANVVMGLPLLAFGLWSSWLMISTAWSPLEARDAESLSDLLFLVFFIATAVTIIARLPEGATRAIWHWLFWTGAIYLAAAVLSGPGSQGRFAAFGGGPNVFARIMLLAAIAAVALYILSRRTRFLAATPFFLVGALFSGSRGGVVAAAIILIVFVFPLARLLGPKRLITASVISGIGVAGAFAVLPQTTREFLQLRFIEQTLVQRYASSRDYLTEQTLDLWSTYPLFGGGVDSFYALQPGGYEFGYPHNLVLATAAESGLIGLIFFAIAVLASTLSLKGARFQEAPHAWLLSMGGLYIMMASLFSGDYYDSRFMWFLMFAGAIEALRCRNVGLRGAGPDPDQQENQAGRITN